MLGKTIWFGLRAPSSKKVRPSKKQCLFRRCAADLLKAEAPSKAAPRSFLDRAWRDGGIRDIAALPDKRLLVVAGAAHGDEVPFSCSSSIQPKPMAM